MQREIFRALLEGEPETVALACKIADISEQKDILAIFGDLGSGKSVFARGFIRRLIPAIDEIPSPTFTLLQNYTASEFEIHHFDLFRLDSPNNALELGIEESFAEAISLIEWPDRLGPLLPVNCLSITLEVVGNEENIRKVCLSGSKLWDQRFSADGINA